MTHIAIIGIINPPKMTEVYKIAYKFIINDKKHWRTLYHGIEHTTFFPYDEWIKAEKKVVKDGSYGREYLSGFHCFKSLEIASQYLSRFKNADSMSILKCLAKGLTVKPTNVDVYLADEIFIPSQK